MKQKGISTIDIIFTSLFLSVILVVVVFIISVTNNSVQSTNARLNLLSLAQNQLELSYGKNYQMKDAVLYFNDSFSLVSDSQARYQLTIDVDYERKCLYNVKVLAVDTANDETVLLSTNVFRNEATE